MIRRTILMYHRVAEDPRDPYSLCVSPDRFEAQLRTIMESAELVDLHSLSSTADQGRRPDRRARAQVVLTLDDGYADNLLAALPIAEMLGAPMTVYVTTGYLGSSAGYWWDRLALLLDGRDRIDLDVEIGGDRLRVLLTGEAASEYALVALHTRLRQLAVTEIEAALATIAEQLATPMPEPLSARVMSRDEVCALAKSPLVTIGAHTVDHVLLGGRGFAEQLETIRRSKEELETLIGCPVLRFAYPYGDGEAFDPASVEAVRRCGFETACTTLGGRVTRLNDRLRLPRRVVRNWHAGEMQDWLRAWRAV